MLAFLDQLGLEKLDYVIATHPDADHIGGMDTVLQNIEVTDGVFFGYLPDKLIPTTKTYEDLLDVIEQKNLDLSLLHAGDTLDLGSGAVLSVLGPVTEEIDSKNNGSVVSRLDFGETSFLFNGDRKRRWKSCCCKAEPTGL